MDQLTSYGGLTFQDGDDGQICDSNPVTIVTLSYLSDKNQKNPPIPCGVAIARGSYNNTCRPLAKDGDDIVGISLRTTYACPNHQGYGAPSCIPTLKSGFVWVTPAEEVNPGDIVIALTAGDKAGALGAKNPGAGRLPVPNARWETAAIRGQKAKLRINI